jgi:hypothetical protein
MVTAMLGVKWEGGERGIKCPRGVFRPKKSRFEPGIDIPELIFMQELDFLFRSGSRIENFLKQLISISKDCIKIAC